MLSIDELMDGVPFILRLWDSAGVPNHWVETLRGDAARRWYDIHGESDWAALRSQAPAVFRHRVSQGEADRVRTSGQRCVVIDTRAVAAGEIGNVGRPTGEVGPSRRIA